MKRIVWMLFALLPTVGASAQEIDLAHYEAMEWRNIGPFRGGRSNTSTGVPSQPGTFYFGSVGGGVWKTTDSGITWKNVTDGFLNTASVGAVAVAPSDPNVLYVGMGEHAVRGVMTSHGDGVYKSTDAGRTWTHMGLPRSRAISRIRIHPSDPDRVYVAVQGAPYGPTEERGIYRSRDGGESWEQVLYVSDSAGASDLDMDPTNPRILYAAFWDHLRMPWEVRSGGDGSGIHKSTDGGTTWERLGEGGDEGFPELKGKMSVSVSANPDRIYALVEADPDGGLYRSEDAGKTWALVNETWTIRARAWYYIKVFADPQNPDVVWVTNAPVMKSIDGGKTFTRVRTPHGDNHDLWIHPDNSDIMINSNDGGANVTENGGETWSAQDNQPTAQFYRVNTDNRFPYYVYGGQQDNSSVAIASRTFGAGIGWKDWYSVGGCESAYTAFDPENPVLVYAGCYMGMISEWDARTRYVRNVMAYPSMPAARASRDMKYRFNWNAPIVLSHHDRMTIYHASNVLLKTDNQGKSWSPVSPDLTRDDDEKQGPGGGPITNEGAGGEIYGTIYYVAESPHDARTIWAGSDDGLVHVTRDGGANWKNVTPADVGEAMINAIEVSPHDPSVAYIAVTKYKFNDFTPLAFKTDDFGESWTYIVDGIEAEAWVRVIREDPKRRGLLYLGSETGLYVSFDDGGHWQSLQLNLPVVPITDLKVQVGANDLVAATQGRAFWILDDLSPLQQAEASSGARLIAPRPAIRVEQGGGFGGGQNLGKNPPAGAVIDFLLDAPPEKADTADAGPVVKLAILDESGSVVRAYASDADEDRSKLETQGGMNRTTWDLRHESPKRVPGAYIFGALRGRKVVPGAYRVRLSIGDDVHEQPLEVQKDPRVDTTLAAFREQDAFLERLEATISEVHTSVTKVRDVKGQVEAVVARAKGMDGVEEVQTAADALVAGLTEVEDALIQKRTVDGQTVINFPTQLNHRLIFLRGAVDGSEVGLIDGARERFDDLMAEWDEERSKLGELIDSDLEAFNQLVVDKRIPPVRPSP